MAFLNNNGTQHLIDLIKAALGNKQDKLIAGKNITFNDTTINALKYYKKSEVTGIAGTSTTQISSTYDVTDTSITSYYDGLVISFVLPVAGVTTYGSVFQIGSLGYKPIVYGTSSTVGTRYPVGGQITMVYNSVQTATAYFTKNTATTVTGCWQVCDYDATTTDARRVYDYYLRPYVGANALYRYKLCALDKDNRLNPITITNQTSTTQVAKTPTSVAIKPEKLWFYASTTTVNAGAAVTAKVLTSNYYGDNMCQYNFNTVCPAYRMIYLRGTYNSTTGLFTLYNDGTSPCTSYYTLVPNNTANITLSSYFTSGYYYWLVGSTYSTVDCLSVFGNNPLYYFDGTNLIPYEQHFINDKQDKSTLESDVASKGFTKNTGTVTSVQVQASTGLVSSQSTAQTGTLNTTISVNSGYKLPTTSEWAGKQNVSTLETDIATLGFTKNEGTVTSVGAGTGLSISGTASVNPTVNVASGYKLPTSTEWSGKQDTDTLETDVAAAGFTKNTGTVTSVAVKMNGDTKGTITSSGTIDLGTVITSHQDISGKQDKSTLETDVAAKGFTKNTGTVTSVRVQADTGLTSSQSTAQTGSLDTTISVASGYKLPTTSEWSGKADASALTSHTGNSTIHVTSTDKSTWSGKQDALVSGTNIKKINGESILGSGNIVTPNDIPNNGVLTMQVNGTQKATFSANQSTAATFNVTAADLGLSQALVFKGITTTDLTDGATTSPIAMKDGTSLTPTIGNVVLTASTVATLPNTEFVWADSKWNKLGDAKSYALSSLTITGTGVLGGGGSLTANRTITHNTSGVTSGSYGDTTNQTPGYGSTFKVPSFTVDSYGHLTVAGVHTVKIPDSDNTNTTYTFTGGTNQFTATPSDGGAAQTVTVTPSITNNITGSGTNGYLAKFTNTNTIGNGPALGTGTTTFLRNDGTWATPPNTDTKVSSAASTTNGNYPILLNNGTDATTSTVLFKSGAYINPSTGNLAITQINGVNVGASPKFTDTDTKVTAVGNHYTPSGGSSTSPTSSGTATRGSTVVMTGITKDAAGHITGVTGYTLPASDNTDTKNTAGSTDTSSKIFLVGATSQAANPQTYSHNTAYVDTDGCLYSNSTKVSVVGHTHTKSDITDFPTIPTVNNATLSLQANGTNKTVFYANDATNRTFNISNGTSSTGNGTISVGGTGVSVYGLGSAAYTASTAYAAASHTHTKSQITDFPTIPTVSGSNGCLAKFNGANSVTSGPAIGTSTTTYLRNDGAWATPPDTKNTAGSTNTSSKIFLVGATSQAANPQTYSNTSIYATNGEMFANSYKVTTNATISYNTSSGCLEIIC